MTDTTPPQLRSFGRVKGRPLRPRQHALMETLLPERAVTIPEQGMIDLAALAGDYRDIWLEIGFGAGEHLCQLARTYPDICCIGAEPYLNGVAACLGKIDDEELANIRLHPGDARDLLAALPPGSLGRVDILFPDPWPKKAHHKRRLINQSLLSDLARVLRPNATLWLATDHRDYAAWMLEHLLRHPAFTLQAWQKADIITPPPDWLATRYQEKTEEQGRTPLFFQVIRSDAFET